MNKTAIENLASIGHEYMERVIPQLDDVEYPLHQVTDYSLSSKESNDGTVHEIARSLLRHNGTHPAQAHLDKPLWTWNGSLAEPTFNATNNPIINTTWCSPQATVNLATGIIDGTLPCTPEIKDKMLERIGATFFAEATPRALMAGLDNEVGFVCRDDEYPLMHVASAPLFFGAIASKKLLALDIHDVTHHAIQMQQWPEFFSRVGAIGYKAFEKDTSGQLSNSPNARLARHLIGLVIDAVFEESLLNDDKNQLYSFGCLNWLSPRDTPASELGSTRNLSDEQLSTSQRWHALYAVKDHYRTQRRASEDLGRPLDWVSRLGYDADKKFKRLAEIPHPAPLANLAINDAYHIEIKAPSTPDELIKNAAALLDDYDL